MKTISIKAKVIIVLIGTLALGAVVLTAVVRHSYNRNVAMVASAALQSAQKTFENIKAGELASLTFGSTGLTKLEGVRELFIKHDRKALYDYVKPMYDELKGMGAGFVLFLEPNGTVFLRMHAPATFGDSLTNVTYTRKCIETQQAVVAVDLARPGFVTATCRPYRNPDGALIGFIIVSGTFDRFLSAMKTQTSDDYLLVGHKKFLDDRMYRNSQKAKGQPDTWEQFPGVVVLGKTAEPNANGRYEQDLEGLPPDGRLLGQVELEGRVFIRGVFPLYDATGNAIGGIFVRHDITDLHQGMKHVQSVAVAAIVVLMLILSVALAALLNKLVFARLKATMNTATRVVGGEFTRQIVPTSDDEVGQLERLFEQFRTIFVGVVDDLEKQQQAGANKQES